MNTQVEFRKIGRESSRDYDTYLWSGEMPEVPAVGDLVNICGDPWRVIERSWAVGLEGDVWCYIRVR